MLGDGGATTALVIPGMIVIVAALCAWRFVIRRVVLPGQIFDLHYMQGIGYGFLVSGVAVLLFAALGDQINQKLTERVAFFGGMLAFFSVCFLIAAGRQIGEYDTVKIIIRDRVGLWEDLEWIIRPKYERGQRLVLGFRDGTVIPIHISMANYEAMVRVVKSVEQKQSVRSISRVYYKRFW